MNMVCLDLEGVLVPEIWIAFAEASGIPELRRTTRDEPDYDKLMRGSGIPFHSADFNFDESILLTGIEAYRRLLKI